MIKELIKDLEREDILEIVKNLAAWASLFFLIFMLSIIAG